MQKRRSIYSLSPIDRRIFPVVCYRTKGSYVVPPPARLQISGEGLMLSGKGSLFDVVRGNDVFTDVRLALVGAICRGRTAGLAVASFRPPASLNRLALPHISDSKASLALSRGGALNLRESDRLGIMPIYKKWMLCSALLQRFASQI